MSIEVKNLVKRFGALAVCDHLNLQIPSGELVATTTTGPEGSYSFGDIRGGDYVVVVNAHKVKFTGKKLTDKTYYWHTGHPGGIKERTADKILGGKYPERILEKAVERMLPKESPLARKQMTHLRIYNVGEHPHQAQNPEVIAFADLNSKNVRSK